VLPKSVRGRHAASLLPHSASKTRVNALMGEKDRMRGFGSGVFAPKSEPPHPNPLPSGEREFVVPAAVYLHGKRLRSRDTSRRPSFFGARSANDFARLQKCGHVKRETGPVQGKGRGGPVFRSSVTRFRRFVAWIERSESRERLRGFIAAPRVSLRSPGLRNKLKEAERRQTQGSTAASCDAARALVERARLTAFHHGSHLRELFHPKGSASGQASWDAV